MSKAAAWLLKINETIYVAVSRMELVHIISNPVITPLPRAPAYCRNVLIWNDNVLPVADISQLLDGDDNTPYNQTVAVISYRDNNNAVQYGGIMLADSPELEHVNNDQLCQLSDDTMNLHAICLSCFNSEKGFHVPIIDMSRLFSSEYSGILETQE